MNSSLLNLPHSDLNIGIHIKKQISHSRLELIVRSLFGWLYITLPHYFMLFFMNIGVTLMSFINFFRVLFTAQISENYYRFIVGYMQWWARVEASRCDLVDGTPDFGTRSVDDKCIINIPFPQRVSRGLALLRATLGFVYVLAPHGFILIFMMIARQIVWFLNWFIILFTGETSTTFHDFMAGTIRWQVRINLYLFYIIDKYPPFSLSDDPSFYVNSNASEGNLLQK